ncbi:MAG: tetratricopeptide repeat protein [Gemmatimonadetes bacterium]|nr:tetratricopeptide repeat protein [Gemmatimonadota bacterium]NIO32820.1 tetratricopeptide repeat protein [Gemmatimonadota bacterium]
MSGPASKLGSFLAELKRRKVYRVAVVYAVVAFVIWQAAEIAFPSLHLPDWTLTFVVVMALIGFPIALVLAWAFEITPEGVRRTELARAETAEASTSPPPAVAQDVQSKSIAVLPFANMSDDPETEYFSDGMTEEIINALTQLEDLRVAARTSCFAFKGKALDVGEIGAKLKVATVLEGSVRRAGNRLRITAQLVNVADGYHLWSERYDREMEDVFAIQDDIARAIAGRLQVTLTGEAGERLVEPPTKSLEAYDLYLKGRFFVNRVLEVDGEGPRKGIDYFEQALALDPGYALAHAGIADAYNFLGNTGILPPKQALPKAKEAALRALELDETLAETHCALGWILMFSDYDWAGAERHFRRAIELAPSSVDAHLRYSDYLLWVQGRFDEAVAEARRGVKLEPTSVVAHTWLGRHLCRVGRYDEAIAQLHKAVELDPSHWHAYHMLAETYRLKSMYPEAIAAVQTAIDLAGPHTWNLGDLALAYAASGKTAEAEAIYDELLARSRREYVQPSWLGLMSAALGRKDEAFEWFDRAYNERDPLLVCLKYFRGSDPLRDDPRFDVLVEKMGLQ